MREEEYERRSKAHMSWSRCRSQYLLFESRIRLRSMLLQECQPRLEVGCRCLSSRLSRSLVAQNTNGERVRMVVRTEEPDVSHGAPAKRRRPLTQRSQTIRRQSTKARESLGNQTPSIKLLSTHGEVAQGRIVGATLQFTNDLQRSCHSGTVPRNKLSGLAGREAAGGGTIRGASSRTLEDGDGDGG